MSAPETEGAAAEDSAALVSAVYQPVVELDDGRVVGWEALARGPHGGTLERPDRLFSAARRAGLIAQVDWECRLAAVAGALDAGLDRSTTLFVNMEPEAIDAGPQADGRAPELWRRAEEELSVAVELPAGALRARPRDLVRAADACRDRGWTVVLDDVGGDRDSLAVLPLVAPDAIKLDLRAAARGDGAARPALEDVAAAVWAEQERTGATLVAEGIETEQDLERARGIGATLGQGWLWGRAGALPEACSAAAPSGLRPERRRELPAGTPFDVVCAAREPREGSAATLAAMSGHVERMAARAGAGAIVLASFQDAARFTRATRARYRALAAEATLVGALAPGMAASPTAGVHGADVAPGDPLRGEWSVVVLCPGHAAALVAREAGEPAPETPGAERRMRFALTHDRELVVAAARTLAARLG